MEKCDFLKLDCEGGEYEILYHASETSLQKIGRIVCEFNIIDRDQRNGKALRTFLIACGFVVDKLVMLDNKSGFICAKQTRNE